MSERMAIESECAIKAKNILIRPRCESASTPCNMFLGNTEHLSLSSNWALDAEEIARMSASAWFIGDNNTTDVERIFIDTINVTGDIVTIAANKKGEVAFTGKNCFAATFGLHISST